MGPNKDGLVRGLKGHEMADKIVITYNKKISL